MDPGNKFYLPIESFLENDPSPLRKRILELIYAAIYEDRTPDVTEFLMKAYDVQCEEDERPEPEELQGEAAWDFMFKTYVKKYVAFGHSEHSAGEGFDWPEAMPRNYLIRVGILRNVALRMAAADSYQHKRLQKAMLELHPEVEQPGL